MRTLAIFNQKYGSAKTTTAVHLAAALGEQESWGSLKVRYRKCADSTGGSAEGIATWRERLMRSAMLRG